MAHQVPAAEFAERTMAGRSVSMLKPTPIGYDAATAREIWSLDLAAIASPFEWQELSGEKFVCLCALNSSSISGEELSVFCARLISLGCAYFCVWGLGCQRVHDIMDELVIGSSPSETDRGSLITTWHPTESLAEAAEFFVACTVPDEEYAPNGCRFGLAITIGSSDWAAEIQRSIVQRNPDTQTQRWSRSFDHPRTP